MSEVNVLISSAGRRVSLVRIFKQTLKDMGLYGEVVGTEISSASPAYHTCDRGFIVPSCKNEMYIERLLEICVRERIRLLIPTIDLDLGVLSANRKRFEACGTRVAVSLPETVEIGADKRLTHRWLTENCFSTVRQILPEDLFSEKGKDWKFPAIAKPRFGSASNGVEMVESLADVERLAKRDDYIVQSLAKGREYTVDFLANSAGKCVCAVPRLRISVRAGEVSKGMTERNPELIKVAHRICEVLPGAYGVLNVQMFWDAETQSTQVIEINPRFGGGFPLTWQAGANLPRWMLEEVLNVPSTANPSAWQDRLLMLRYDEAVFVSAAQAGL
jgi:carbamoyl-phosphate synthase large subunit